MNIAGYIPSRLRTQVSFPQRSFDEMAWGPKMMMDRDNTVKANLGDLDSKLDFEYSEKDDKYVAPKIDALRNELYSLEDEILTKGYDPQLEKKLVAFRRKYQQEVGSKGDIGRAVGNYGAIKNAISSYEANNKNAPEWFKQKAKKYLASTYSGMYDADKNFTQFSPGEVTKYRELADDAIDMLKSAGASDQDLALFRSGHASIQPVTLPNGAQMLKIVEQTPGNIRSNKGQLEAGLNQLLTEYLDPKTDRGRFTQIAEYSPEYIAKSLSNIGNMMQSTTMSKQPGWDASYQHMPEPDKAENTPGTFSTFSTFPTFPTLTANPKKQKELDTKFNNTIRMFDAAGNFNKNFGKRQLTTSKEASSSNSWAPSSIWGDMKESLDIFNPKYAFMSGEEMAAQPKPSEVSVDKKINEAEQVFNDYKEKYKDKWNQFNLSKKEKDPTTGKYVDKAIITEPLIISGKPIYSERDWFEAVHSKEQNEAAILDSKAILNAPNFYDNLQKIALFEGDNAKPFTQIEGGKEKDKASWNEFNAAVKDSGIEFKNLRGVIDSSGKLTIEVPTSKGKKIKEFEVNIPDAALKPAKKAMNEIKEVLKSDSPSHNNQAWYIGSSIRARVHIDPIQDTKNMYIEQLVPSVDQNGQTINTWEVVDPNASLSTLLQLTASQTDFLISGK